MDPRLSRAYGAFAGLALGDALGMPTQAMSPEQIRAVYGRVTGLVDGDASQPYAPGMPAGSVTDDTEQALLIASLLVRGRGSSSGHVALDAGDFSHALLSWEDSMIERGSLDLLGPSTKAALERVRAGEDPLTVGGLGTTNGARARAGGRGPADRGWFGHHERRSDARHSDRYRSVDSGSGSVRGRRLVLLPGDACDATGFPVGSARGGGGIACS